MAKLDNAGKLRLKDAETYFDNGMSIDEAIRTSLNGVIEARRKYLWRIFAGELKKKFKKGVTPVGAVPPPPFSRHVLRDARRCGIRDVD